MAGTKISELPAASTPLTGTELVPVVQSGVTKQTALTTIPYVPSGTGAVTTTVQAKLRQTVSVKDYGAVGDGVTDDAPAIEAASKALYTAGGGTLFFPSGTYLLGTLSADSNSYYSYITLRDGVSFVGAGRGESVLKVKSGENARFSSSNAPNILATQQSGLLSNVRIADMTFDWNGANNLLTALMTARNNASILTINGAQNVTIERVNFKECPGNQDVYFKNQNYVIASGSNVIVRDCEFKDVGSGLSGNYNQDHTSVYICEDDSAVEDCRFYASQMVNGTCFELHGTRNYAKGNRSNYFSRAFYAASDYIEVTDITVVDGQHNNCANAFAISAPTYAVNNVMVSGNTFRQAAGLSFPSVNYFVNGSTVSSCSRLVVTNNRFIGNNYANNRCFQHYKMTEFVFSGNTIKSFNDGTNGYGIISSNVDIGGSKIAHSIAIQDNLFDDVTVPIQMTPSTLGVDYLRIQNNMFGYVAGGSTRAININMNSGTGIISGNKTSGFTSICTLAGTNDISGMDVVTPGSVAYTPVVQGSTSAGTGTYSTQSGSYQIIGKLCFFKIGLVWSAHTGTGNLRISLPFTSKSGGTLAEAVNFSYVTNLSWTANQILLGEIDPNTNYIQVSTVASGGANSAVALDTAATIYCSGYYELP